MINFLKTIADEQRLRILNLLQEKSLCVCEIEKVLKLKQSTLSTHLSKLKNADIIIGEKNGKWIYYSINKKLDSDFYSILQSILKNFGATDTALKDISILNNLDSSCSDNKTILIVCTKNSCRSQITEAILKNNTTFSVFSAGTNPGTIINKNVKTFLKEKFPNNNFFPKHINNFLEENYDTVIFVCKEAYKSHKNSINAQKILFWDIEDIDFDDVNFEQIDKAYNDIYEHLKKENLI
jgi:ArsR family transcriptional regulator